MSLPQVSTARKLLAGSAIGDVRADLSVTHVEFLSRTNDVPTRRPGRLDVRLLRIRDGLGCLGLRSRCRNHVNPTQEFEVAWLAKGKDMISHSKYRVPAGHEDCIAS